MLRISRKQSWMCPFFSSRVETELFRLAHIANCIDVETVSREKWSQKPSNLTCTLVFPLLEKFLLGKPFAIGRLERSRLAQLGNTMFMPARYVRERIINSFLTLLPKLFFFHDMPRYLSSSLRLEGLKCNGYASNYRSFFFFIFFPFCLSYIRDTLKGKDLGSYVF